MYSHFLSRMPSPLVARRHECCRWELQPAETNGAILSGQWANPDEETSEVAEINGGELK